MNEVLIFVPTLKGCAVHTVQQHLKISRACRQELQLVQD